ncbi:Blue-light Inhibitor of Cryptochromes 1 [Hibiscus trionum]|uniref:Blue-light Inhibitor of Cryptochromes 1 n=1 Tax=Hibiscus trionum TaxID=183268 RepID=A0A9W7JG50_HIBTR|nr:Blue-light Inhibitor of Cryptochromes 1 [Hibiscus trionum]
MNVEPTQMTTHPPNPSQYPEEPNKTQQADEGSSLKGRYPSADGVRQVVVVVDEVAIGAARGAEAEEISEQDNGRERLKRHRIEMANSRVWIPDIWGQEELLKDWIDCSAFDDCLVPGGIMSARAALVEEGRRATSGRRRIENRC